MKFIQILTMVWYVKTQSFTVTVTSGAEFKTCISETRGYTLNLNWSTALQNQYAGQSLIVQVDFPSDWIWTSANRSLVTAQWNGQVAQLVINQAAYPSLSISNISMQGNGQSDDNISIFQDSNFVTGFSSSQTAITITVYSQNGTLAAAPTTASLTPSQSQIVILQPIISPSTTNSLACFNLSFIYPCAIVNSSFQLTILSPEFYPGKAATGGIVGTGSRTILVTDANKNSYQVKASFGLLTIQDISGGIKLQIPGATSYSNFIICGIQTMPFVGILNSIPLSISLQAAGFSNAMSFSVFSLQTSVPNTFVTANVLNQPYQIKVSNTIGVSFVAGTPIYPAFSLLITIPINIMAGNFII